MDDTGSNNVHGAADHSQNCSEDLDVQGDVEEGVPDNHHPDNKHQSDNEHQPDNNHQSDNEHQPDNVHESDNEHQLDNKHQSDNEYQSEAPTNGADDHLAHVGDIVAAETETVQQSAGSIPTLFEKTDQEPGGTRDVVKETDVVEETEEILTESEDSAPELARHESSLEGGVDGGNTVVKPIKEADSGGNEGEEEAEVRRANVAITIRECVN